MRFSELDGRRIGVWGLGRETRSLIDQLRRRLPAAEVAVLADDAALTPETLAALPEGTRAVSGDDVAPALAGCDVVVRSPGVSVYSPAALAIKAAGVPLTTATSLWLAESSGVPVIGITGTKGKSTTALLTAHLARATGRRVELAGNVGRPALDLLDEPTAGLVVLELSSYQAADLATGPDVAVVTNLYSEHLPWHGDYATYRADKLRLARLPEVGRIVASGRDGELRAAFGEAAVPVDWFGAPGGYDLTDEGVVLDGRLVLARADLPLPGDHNALNLCAALQALAAAGIAEPSLPAALAGFHALPHRLEVLGVRDGLTWVNDSISTTPESTLAGLGSFPAADVTLLAGGLDRGQDYAVLGAELARRGARLITLPDTGPRIAVAARVAGVPEERISETGGLDEAVGLARTLSAPGAVVLLSPAAASQPHFKDFEERGELLRTLVGAAAPGAPSPAAARIAPA